MGASTTQAETRLAMLLDEREVTTEKWEALNASINGRDDKTLNEVEQEHILKYRERAPYKGKTDEDYAKAKKYMDWLKEL